MLPRYSFAHCHHRIALHQTGWAGNFSCHWHLYFSHGFPVPFPHPPQRSTPAPPGAATLFQLCHQLLHVVFDALILSQNCIPCYYTVQLALPVFAAAANPKIFPRTVGGPAMQAPTSNRQGSRKNSFALSKFHRRGGAWLRPHLPQLQTPKYSPAPLAGLRCRPLQAKGKVFAKIYRSFVILS